MFLSILKNASVIICVFFCTAQYVAAQNIDFVTGSWKEILAKAEKEHKLIFVDVYAVWCGPCKTMAKTVFTQTKVAEHFNATFINYIADAEKGEGRGIAEKYEVNSFPTYLFINSEGTLVHKVEGAMSADQFIAESKKATNKQKAD